MRVCLSVRLCVCEPIARVRDSVCVKPSATYTRKALRGLEKLITPSLLLLLVS